LKDFVRLDPISGRCGEGQHRWSRGQRAKGE
jgi:hypothetical protein